MDESALGLMEIVGPIILLALLVWVVMRSRRKPGQTVDTTAETERPTASMTRKSAAGARGPTTSERPAFTRPAMVRIERLAAAPAPARNARAGEARTKRVARRGDRSREDARWLSSDDLRACR